MVQKSGGPDGWEVRDVLLLPEAWWLAHSHLWSVVINTGSVPERWCEARVALLDKLDNEYRPLSIASIGWRIGAKVLV